jgi:hypothetical protein
MGVPTNLRKVVRAEKDAEQVREAGEQSWREAWWETTIALAAVPASPREQLSEAIAFVADTLGQSRNWVTQRRSCGRHFASLELSEQIRLIPRFAVVAAQAKADPQTAAELIHQAEHEGSSLREFSAMLTGRSWTNAPENMTSEERLHVARTELKSRPDEVMADDEVEEAVDQAWRNKRISRAGLAHVEEEQEARLHNFDRNASKAFGLPEVPIQHLNAAAGEIDSAIVARDIHGLENEDAWGAAIAKIEQHLALAKNADPARWSKEDQEIAKALGLNL